MIDTIQDTFDIMSVSFKAFFSVNELQANQKDQKEVSLLI